MGFSVGLFEDFDSEALLSPRDRAVTALPPTCHRVAVWHQPAEQWRATLIEALLTGPLKEFAARRVARLGRGRNELLEANAVQKFLEWTEPASTVHQRHVLMLEDQGLTAVLLTDVDGEALDVFVAGPRSIDVVRASASLAWTHLLGSG